MDLSLAIALLALLVAVFALVALVAVYARVRGLEALRAAELSGYATLVGRPAPPAVRPREGQEGGVVAVLDADCALCHAVLAALGAAAGDPRIRWVALVDRIGDLTPQTPDASETLGCPEVLADAGVRADLYEGYSPTLLAVAADGRITGRRFVYADTDLPALLRDLTHSEGKVSRT